MNKFKHQYLIQQPRRLETLALIKVGEWIVLQTEKLILPETHTNPLAQVVRLFSRTGNSNKIEAELSRKIEMIHSALECNVPKMLYDNLAVIVTRALTQLENTIKKSTWHIVCSGKNLIWQIMETLFNKNLTTLIANTEMLRTSLYAKSHSLTALQRLELYPTERNCSIVDETNIIQMLKQLPSLKNLALEDVCTDNILRCLVQNCKLIEELNICNSKSINDKNVGFVTGLLNIKSIEVYETNVSYKGIKNILLSCDNLIHIGVSLNFIVLALEDIISYKENADVKFKLQHLVSEDELISLKHLQLAIKMCPKIEKIRIIKDQEHTSENYLSVLNDLEDLHVLELQEYSFYTDNIGNVLEERGSSLMHLHLVGVEQVDISALKNIYSTCPNLQCLFLNQCSYLKEPLHENGLFHSELTTTYISSVKNLKKIALHTTSSDSMPTEEHLLFLFSNCPNVEYINLGDAVDITDDIMLEILDKNPLIYLKDLRLVNSKLTEVVMDSIIKNCVNCPKISNYYTITDLNDASSIN